MGVALALLMAGCASDNNGGEQYRYTPPVAKATNNTQEMQIPVDLVWARAEKWFGDHGLNIENSQRGSGLMTANVENSVTVWSGWIAVPWVPRSHWATPTCRST